MKTKKLIAKIVIIINLISYFSLVASVSILTVFGGLIVEISNYLILILISIGSLFWFLLPATLSYFYKEYRKRFIIILIINLLIAIFISSSFGGYSKERRLIHSDSKRSADIKLLESGLELYFNDFGFYPKVETGCQDISVLDEFFLSNYKFKAPREVRAPYGHPEYQYAVSEDGTQFVLKITLLYEKSKPLAEDLDGNILGCDCDDPNYCIGTQLYKK